MTRLGELFAQWLQGLQGNPGKLELATDLKDFVGVLKAAPTNPATLPCAATGRGLLLPVQSPYLGGIPWERLDDQGDTKHEQLSIANMNPGGTGLLAL